jgi:hypothetical protein
LKVTALQSADLSAGWIREQADLALLGNNHPIPQWADRASKIRCLGKFWTLEQFKELASKTEAFKMPSDVSGRQPC